MINQIMSLLVFFCFCFNLRSLIMSDSFKIMKFSNCRRGCWQGFWSYLEQNDIICFVFNYFGSWAKKIIVGCTYQSNIKMFRTLVQKKYINVQYPKKYKNVASVVQIQLKIQARIILVQLSQSCMLEWS